MNEGDVEDCEEGEGRAWCVDGQLGDGRRCSGISMLRLI